MSVTLYVKGFHEEGNEHFPELNLANGNWEAIYTLCSIANYQEHDEYSTTGCGDINNPEKLSQFITKLITVLNNEKKVEKHTTETYSENNWVGFGRSKDYLLEKVEGVLYICRFAKKHNRTVYWA